MKKLMGMVPLAMLIALSSFSPPSHSEVLEKYYAVCSKMRIDDGFFGYGPACKFDPVAPAFYSDSGNHVLRVTMNNYCLDANPGQLLMIVRTWGMNAPFTGRNASDSKIEPIPSPFFLTHNDPTSFRDPWAGTTTYDIQIPAWLLYQVWAFWPFQTTVEIRYWKTLTNPDGTTTKRIVSPSLDCVRWAEFYRWTPTKSTVGH